ncbi:Glutathione S-transferase 1 [Grifola frondosa]|uniref:Glutathione S-transferase 1 n=1 Tax=Grifola frondosa TaxID=5627 RepID=A0A1C7M3F0_GRIFR|nr:Glutathione S-transferase 1 [Grifola frondosa]
MSHGKQFTLYSHYRGANGWKAAIALEELGLTYHTIYFNFDKLEHKNAEYVKLNPNGRIPTIIDHHNNDFTVGMSSLAVLCMQLTIARKGVGCDPDVPRGELQWLFFQASGQGPYFGQVGWFKLFHPEKVPSAILSKNGSLAASAPSQIFPSSCGNHLATTFLLADYEGFNFEKDFPAVHKWHNTMLARPSVKKCMELRESLLNAH